MLKRRRPTLPSLVALSECAHIGSISDSTWVWIMISHESISSHFSTFPQVLAGNRDKVPLCSRRCLRSKGHQEARHKSAASRLGTCGSGKTPLGIVWIVACRHPHTWERGEVWGTQEDGWSNQQHDSSIYMYIFLYLYQSCFYFINIHAHKCG